MSRVAQGRTAIGEIPNPRPNPYRIPAGSPWFHVVNVSGGRSSAYMLRCILDAHGGALPARCEAIFANTGKERDETLAFVAELGDRWGVDVRWVEFDYDPNATPKYGAVEVNFKTASRNGEPFDALLESGAWLPAVTRRTCTSELKIATIQRYLWRRHGLTKRQVLSLIGFRFDEPKRWQPAMFRECATRYPMVVDGVTKEDVATFWAAQPFDLGIESERGNCDCCYLKPRRNLLSTIRAEPERAQWWIDVERRHGGRTFRIGESFAELRAAAIELGSGNEPIPPPGAGDEAEGLPCFCSD